MVLRERTQQSFVFQVSRTQHQGNFKLDVLICVKIFYLTLDEKLVEM